MRIVFSLLLSLTLFFTTMPKAEALVGIAISSQSTRSVGGLMSLAGAGGVAAGVTLTAIFGNSYAFLALSVLGATAGIIGIVVLDEKSAELKFSLLDSQKAALLGVSNEEAEVFNSEIEELNLIKGEIEAQISKKTSDREIVEQWKTAQKYLSPETLKVATRIIAASVETKR